MHLDEQGITLARGNEFSVPHFHRFQHYVLPVLQKCPGRGPSRVNFVKHIARETCFLSTGICP